MKTQIEKKLRRKTNVDLIKTIISGKKKESWLLVSKKISGPRRKRISVNLEEINEQVKDNDIAVIPGRVLGNGEIKKKIKISALGYSENARKKLLESKVEFNLIGEEIKSNPEGKGIRVLG